MYYKLRQDILFRQYEEYGYITDNSEYGYRMLDDTRPKRNEKFVSQSGAVMLSTLERIPKHIDIIVEELSRIYTGVDFETLKSDTIEFFQYFVEEGYLSVGESVACCQDIDISNNSDVTEMSVAIACLKQTNFFEAYISRLQMPAMNVVCTAISPTSIRPMLWIQNSSIELLKMEEK